MKNVLTIFLCVLMISFSLFASKQNQTEREKQYRPGVVIVKLKSQNDQFRMIDAASTLSRLESAYGIGIPQQLFSTISVSKKMIGTEELERVYTFTVQTPVDVEILAKKIAQNPSVEYAQPDYLMFADFVPNDPMLAQVYPLGLVKAQQAWDIQKGDSTVVIAIIDTGVDWDHPDLDSAIWKNKNEIPNNGIDDDANGFIDDTRGWDFVATSSTPISGEDSTVEDNNPMDFNGHGTHCAGIAAGITNNGVGIASLGGGCKIMPIRIGWHTAAGQGTGYTSSMAKGFIYAANNGASVASLSFGSDAVAAEGAKYAFKNGVVIINSAGNSNTDVAGAVGALPEALSVAATNSLDNKASYSSYNAAVDISAPGGDFSSGNNQGFLSTVVNPSALYSGKLYEYFQGTSMAGPFVAAVAGLIKSQHKTWSPAQIMFQITGTADNIEANLSATHKGKMGYGRFNALRALTETPAAPKPKLVFLNYKINDVSGGNGNGILEPGENANINVTIRNEWGDAQNLIATLATNHWTTNVTKPSSNFGLMYGISKIDSSQRTNLNDEFTIAVSADAIPQVIPFTVSFTATGGYTQQFTFNIALGSRLLLVDDDDGIANVEQYYTNALNSLGTVYDIWDHTKLGTPSASVLQNYQAVIWSCEWAFPSLDSSDRTSISTYLNNGGKLFLSGQDIAWDLGDPAGPENVASNGAAKTFLETYLKSKFIADDAANATLTGVAGDSIGNGISISRLQPGRDATQQYPDVIDTTGGSVFSFKYSGGTFTGKGGAVLYSKNYKLAFFSFGGFESITDATKRVLVMERMLKWMLDYSLAVDQLPTTENTSTSFPVNALITTKSNVQNVSLYWDIDGSFPFNKIAMTLSSGKYSANIPSQSNNSNVEYFVLAKTATGYLPYTINKFFVGPDIIKPVFTSVDTISNSINLSGPYPITVSVTDNIAVDTNSITLKYSVNNGTENSVKLTRLNGSLYQGKITPIAPLSVGDIISYYVNATDASAAKNNARYPVTGFKTFIIGRQMIDNFEKIDSLKWTFNGWGYSSTIKRGTSSITDSPTGNYLPNSDKSLVLVNGIDLSGYAKAVLQFHRKSSLHTSDTAFIEISRNNVDWITLKKFTGVSFGVSFTFENLSITEYTGSGNSNVKIRFRLKTDASSEADGIYFDDVEVAVNELATSVESQYNTLPTVYALEQNFPNPFNPSTSIRYSVPALSKVNLKVYDAIGREVAQLVNDEQQPGFYETKFDASKLSSGIYFYRISAGTFVDSKKMLLVK